MPSQTLSDINRLPISFKKSLVKEVLPEFFAEEYPNFILFLETYYDSLDSAENFGDLIDDLYTIRDIEAASLANIDNLFYEIGMGVSHTLFQNPREVIRNFARFFRVKGSLYSAEGFFRAFFGIDVEIEYPKTNLFILNESEIGIESLKVLQDGGLYQVLSHLIKAPISISTWGGLYKKFVHPAGFYLGAEVQISNVAVANLNAIEVIFDSASNVVDITEIASVVPLTFSSISLLDKMGATDYLADPNTGDVLSLNVRTGILENAGSYDLKEANDSDKPIIHTRLSSTETVRKYAAATIAELALEYETISDLANASSPTVDQSLNNNFGINVSNTYETVDQEEFVRYDSN